MLIYSRIEHAPRREMGISVMEYVVADMIYHLSVNPKSPVKGWCNMSRENMAKEVDFTKRGIIKLIDRLCEIGILEKNDKGNLRTSPIWYEFTVYQVHQQPKSIGEQSTPALVNKVHRRGEQSTPYIDININTDNNTHTPGAIDLSETTKIKVAAVHTENPFPLKSETSKNPPVPAAPPLVDAGTIDFSGLFVKYTQETIDISNLSPDNKPPIVFPTAPTVSDDPVKIITDKILSRSAIVDRWKGGLKTKNLKEDAEEFLQKEARKAAHGWIKKQVGMTDNEVLASATRTGAMVFISWFEGSWLPNVDRIGQVTEMKPNGTRKPEPKTFKYL